MRLLERLPTRTPKETASMNDIPASTRPTSAIRGERGGKTPENRMQTQIAITPAGTKTQRRSAITPPWDIARGKLASTFITGLTMRSCDAGMRRRQTKLFYPNHRLPPWPNEDAARDRSNRLLGAARIRSYVKVFGFPALGNSRGDLQSALRSPTRNSLAPQIVLRNEELPVARLGVFNR